MIRSPLRFASLLGAVIAMVTGRAPHAVGQARKATQEDIAARARAGNGVFTLGLR